MRVLEDWKALATPIDSTRDDHGNFALKVDAFFSDPLIAIIPGNVSRGFP